MSSKRSRRTRQSSEGASSSLTSDQINDLVSKLHQLLPHINRNGPDKVSTARLIEEACNYIKNKHKEIDGLSERLSVLFSTTDPTAQVSILRDLLVQSAPS